MGKNKNKKRKGKQMYEGGGHDYYTGHRGGTGSTTTASTPTSHSSAPKVVIDDMVYQKIMWWVNKSNNEVSGLGKVRRVGDVIHVIDVMLLPQKNSGSTTDIEGDDVGKAMFELKDTEGDLRFWWHSHVDMAVFWSGTDMDTMKKVAAGGWFVNTVFNKRREMRTAISMNDPFPAILDNLETTIQRSLDGNLVATWDAEYKEKVTDHVPKHEPWKGNNYSNWRGQSTAAEQGLASAKRQQGDVARIVGKIWPPEADHSGAGSTHQSNPYHQSGESSQESEMPGSQRSLLSDGGFQTPHQVLGKRDELERKIHAIETQERNLAAKHKAIPGGMIAAKARYQSQLDDVEADLDILETYGMISSAERLDAIESNTPIPEGGVE